MKTINENVKIKNDVLDRVPLSKESSQIVREAIRKMTTKYPTVKISKKDLVNWIVEENFKELTPTIEKDLHEKFRDEIKFLESMVKDLKRKRRKGETVSVDELILQFNSKPKKKRAKKKVDQKAPPKTPETT